MNSLDFESLPTEFPNTGPEESFMARDGAELPFRYYDANSATSLILLHGSGSYSLYLSELAARIAAAGAANVYTPDLRGHGRNPIRRGDIDYVDQLEDDISDLIRFVRRRDLDSTVVLGGHSSGGGLAIRVAGSDTRYRPDAYLLLTPFLQHDAPTVRPQSGGWSRPKLTRIITLTILNKLGITAFNGAAALEFNLPRDRRSGYETLSYSYRLMTGFSPRDYRVDLREMREPVLVLVGSNDEAFYADRFVAVFSELAPHARVESIPGAGHLGLVFESSVEEMVVSWLRELSAGRPGGRCS